MKEKLKTETPGEMSNINTEDETSLHVSIEIHRVVVIQCVLSWHAKIKKVRKCTGE